MGTIKTNSSDQAFFGEVISKLCGIVFVVDLETSEYIWGNDKYSDMFGYQKDDILRNMNDFAEKYFHPDDKKIVIDRINYFRENNHDSWSGVYRIRHKNNYWVWVYSKIAVFKRDEHGTPKQLIGLVLDAFDNFRTEKRIAALIKERLNTRNRKTISKLTKREIEITCLIAIGYTYKEIAIKLFIQPDTVNKHRKNILRKLELNNIASLVSFAKESGLA